jgi:hypothetical protein
MCIEWVSAGIDDGFEGDTGGKGAGLGVIGFEGEGDAGGV